MRPRVNKDAAVTACRQAPMEPGVLFGCGADAVDVHDQIPQAGSEQRQRAVRSLHFLGMHEHCYTCPGVQGCALRQRIAYARHLLALAALTPRLLSTAAAWCIPLGRDS